MSYFFLHVSHFNKHLITAQITDHWLHYWDSEKRSRLKLMNFIKFFLPIFFFNSGRLARSRGSGAGYWSAGQQLLVFMLTKTSSTCASFCVKTFHMTTKYILAILIRKQRKFDLFGTPVYLYNLSNDVDQSNMNQNIPRWSQVIPYRHVSVFFSTFLSWGNWGILIVLRGEKESGMDSTERCYRDRQVFFVLSFGWWWFRPFSWMSTNSQLISLSIMGRLLTLHHIW